MPDEADYLVCSKKSADDAEDNGQQEEDDENTPHGCR